MQNVREAIWVVFSKNDSTFKYLKMHHDMHPLSHILLLKDLDIFEQVVFICFNFRIKFYIFLV
jgi:hypothetical protein